MKLFRQWMAVASLGLAALGVTGAGAVRADDKPVVVVELFTSQGCSSCPPADAFLRELARRPDVVALSLHVDYWDYIGWKDSFARKEFTQRQHGYARAGHRQSVYTPQMIIQGREHVVGNHPLDVTDLIAAYQKRPQSVDMTLSREGGKVAIRLSPASGGARAKGPLLVQLVSFEPSARVDIRRGENAGHSYTYANVVRDWQVVGEWDGKRALAFRAQMPGDLKAAVIVQHKGFGPVVAAARVE